MGDKGEFAELKNLKQIYRKEEIQQNTFHLHRKSKRKVFLVLVVIPLGFEPKTHALEGRCSNPTELRNHFVFAVQSYRFIFMLQSVTANNGCEMLQGRKIRKIRSPFRGRNLLD